MGTHICNRNLLSSDSRFCQHNLVTFYADCVPLFFVDPVHRAIGLSHSGWRGTVGRMGKVTLELMQEQYGTDPAQVFAAIGPSICQECYEVSGDVIGEFQEAFDESLWQELFYEKTKCPGYSGYTHL